MNTDEVMMNDIAEAGQWIWENPQRLRVPNQYVEFRHTFVFSFHGERVLLRVSADTDFAVWMNDRFVGCGQYSDFPSRPSYTQFDIKDVLVAGKNDLLILVHYCGEEHSSYIAADAGLWFEIRSDSTVTAASGVKTLARLSPCYRPEFTARISQQRGFNFHYDANVENCASAPALEGDTWRKASLLSDRPQPLGRPVQPLLMGTPVAGLVIAQGVLRRASAQGETLGRLMQTDFLSARRSWEVFSNIKPQSSPPAFPLTIQADSGGASDGFYLVIDLNEEQYGFPFLEIDCDGPCTMDIAIGEHLDDLRVRARVGGREFASRYVARQGAQRFAHYLERYAGRYVQLHVTGLRGKIEIKECGLLPVEYPVTSSGSFETQEVLIDRIWLTARRTLHRCMGEHYEDCPWREQALYTNDSRSMMLATYYAFGAYEFARASLDLQAQSLQLDGYLELCAPARVPITIPCFSSAWILAVEDYLMYSGDRAFVARMLPAMCRIVDLQLASITNGALPCPIGKRFWHFYDWASGLDGTQENDCTRFAELVTERFDAPLNFYLLLTLKAIGRISATLGDQALSDRLNDRHKGLRETIHQLFWDSDHAAYLTYRGEGVGQHFSELTQALAILAGVPDEPQRKGLQRDLISQESEWVPTTLGQTFYKFEALLQDTHCASFVWDSIVRDWSHMLFKGATTFWETLRGSWDFNQAGSLCHGWSATPLYFFGAYGLGLKPTEPGFAKFSVRPRFGIERANGAVPTPSGPVRIVLGKELTGTSAAIELPNRDHRVVSQCDLEQQIVELRR